MDRTERVYRIDRLLKSGTRSFAELQKPLAISRAQVNRDIAYMRERLFARCRWTRLYYLWRPNLRDESDNHVVELAVAGGAQAIVTRNKRDFRAAELRFENLAVLTPAECLRRTTWLP